jgi:hypothetical protein
MSFLQEPLSQILIRPQRKIGDIYVNVVISENTNDSLSITKQPVQQGASITDHSFLEPTIVNMTAYFKNNIGQDLSDVYQQLLDLQASRVPFDVVTPKRIYRSMLIATLTQTTDKNTENTLAVLFTFQQIIIVSVSVAVVPRGKQKNAAVTGKTENAGKKSALVSLKEGLGL